MPNIINLENWSRNDIQNHVGSQMAVIQYSTATFLREHMGPEGWDRYTTALAKGHAKSLRIEGVNSPLTLVQHLENFESNVYNATVTITGNENKVTVKRSGGSVHQSYQQICKEPSMGCKIETFTELGINPLDCTKKLSTEFGFKCTGTFNMQNGVLEYTIMR